MPFRLGEQMNDKVIDKLSKKIEESREIEERRQIRVREEKTKTKRVKKKVKVKAKEVKTYRTQVIFGVVGGIILILVGAIGSAGFYEFIINYAIKLNYLPREYGALILNILIYLATGGGLTVIAGSLIIPKIRKLGNWLIGIGAGISLVSLLIRIFFLGPIIQNYVSLAYRDINNLFTAFRILGIEIGLIGLGVILSFMATFETYRWTIIIGAMSFFSMFAGLSSDPRIFEYIREALGIPEQYWIFNALIMFLLYVGAVLLVISLLAGAGYIRLSKIVVVICLIATIFSLISIILDVRALVSYTDWVAILQYIRLISACVVYGEGIYFIKKA